MVLCQRPAALSDFDLGKVKETLGTCFSSPLRHMQKRASSQIGRNPRAEIYAQPSETLQPDTVTAVLEHSGADGTGHRIPSIGPSRHVSDATDFLATACQAHGCVPLELRASNGRRKQSDRLSCVHFPAVGFRIEVSLADRPLRRWTWSGIVLYDSHEYARREARDISNAELSRPVRPIWLDRLC